MKVVIFIGFVWVRVRSRLLSVWLFQGRYFLLFPVQLHGYVSGHSCIDCGFVWGKGRACFTQHLLV